MVKLAQFILMHGQIVHFRREVKYHDSNTSCVDICLTNQDVVNTNKFSITTSRETVARLTSANCHIRPLTEAIGTEQNISCLMNFDVGTALLRRCNCACV